MADGQLSWARDDALALATAGLALAYVVGELDDAAAFIDQALALNPNLAWTWGFGGFVKTWLGELEAAIERVTRAMRLSPQDSQLFTCKRLWPTLISSLGAMSRRCHGPRRRFGDTQTMLLPTVRLR